MSSDAWKLIRSFRMKICQEISSYLIGGTDFALLYNTLRRIKIFLSYSGTIFDLRNNFLFLTEMLISNFLFQVSVPINFNVRDNVAKI